MNRAEYVKQYCLDHREQRMEYNRQWRLDNRKHVLEYQKQHYQKNRKHKNEREKQRRYEMRLKIFDLLGSRVCVRCGFSDIRALQLDHINSDGHRLRKIETVYTMTLRYIKNSELAKKEIQVLCANCNWIKKYEKDEVARKVIYA